MEHKDENVISPMNSDIAKDDNTATKTPARPRRGWLWSVAVLLLCSILVCAWAGQQVYHRWQAFAEPGPLTEATTIDIIPGMSVTDISHTLQTAGIIADAQAFRWITYWQGKTQKLRAGHYQFDAGVSAQQVQQKLEQGKTHLYRLTIAEGLTSQQILGRISAHPQLSGDTPQQLAEATVMPETYHFEKATSRSRLLDLMQQSWQKETADLWSSRDPDIPLENLKQAIILASIVEKEAVDPAEMPTIAGVFHNRLRRNMRLQSDPTVIYALTEGSGKLNRRLLRKDWQYEHPYNTYHVQGLPPGPIAHPSVAALKAVLQPADHDYLFFVADGLGGHCFAETYAQHKENVELWRQFQKKQTREKVCSASEKGSKVLG